MLPTIDYLIITGRLCKAVVFKKVTAKNSIQYGSRVYVVPVCAAPVCDEPYFAGLQNFL